MKYSKMFVPTLREVPAEAEIASHQLMLRAGLMRKVASGLYSYLPMGWRTIRKIEKIVDEEMTAAGAQELMFPMAQPAELWQASGRWDVYGDELWRVKDRHGRDFCLSPTAEEVATSTVMNDISSYKQLPLMIYQTQDKYRDERRPRFGLMRSREFIMKDCYSFDRDDAGLDVSYHLMYDAYSNVFDRCGLNYRPVKADNGAIGGSSSHEFMVLAESGEAEILYCDTCDYAANVEIAECAKGEAAPREEAKPLEKVLTPDCKTIDDVAAFLKLDSKQTMKALFYMADENPVLIFVRGDRRLNEIKVQNYLGARLLYMGTDVDLENAGVVQGFIGPCGQDTKKIRVLIDEEVAEASNLCCGANEAGYHLINANYGRDFEGEIGHFRMVEEGERCPVCGGILKSARGIEVGQVFKLGTKYSISMNANYLDENGKANPFVMGCYGIGIGRTMAASIEQNHDENGIVWPKAIAPFEVVIVPVSEKSERQMTAAEELYNGLRAKGIDVLLDDRAERAGVKFKDADLIGIPFRVTIGDKGLDKGMLEYKIRKSGEGGMIPADNAVDEVLRLLETVE